jgi:hypothetical protein
MTNSSDSLKGLIQSKVQFLETQLQELNHYLPETYEYLMSELDHQRRLLAELIVNEYFSSLEPDDSI